MFLFLSSDHKTKGTSLSFYPKSLPPKHPTLNILYRKDREKRRRKKHHRPCKGASSTYEVVETRTGGKLSRHDLHIQQLGPETVTEISPFHLSGSNQTQDLHSRLVLDHPRGYSRQLHKCIVTHSSGQVVFDGNIKVKRYLLYNQSLDVD